MVIGKHDSTYVQTSSSTTLTTFPSPPRLRIHDFTKRLQRIKPIHIASLSSARFLARLKHVRSIRQRTICKPLRRLAGGAERVDAVRELIDGELEVRGDVAEALLDGFWIC